MHTTENQAQAAPFETVVRLVPEPQRPSMFYLGNYDYDCPKFGLLQLNPAKSIAFMFLYAGEDGISCGAKSRYFLNCSALGCIGNICHSAPLLCPCVDCYQYLHNIQRSALGQAIVYFCGITGIRNIFVTLPRFFRMSLGVTFHPVSQDLNNPDCPTKDNPSSSRSVIMELVGRDVAEKSFAFCGQLPLVGLSND